MGLIDATKAIESIDEIVCSMSVCINSDYCNGMQAMKDAAIHAIEEQPTVDAVPVCRCCDCKYSKDGVGGRLKCTWHNWWQEPDWFCADGERR